MHLTRVENSDTKRVSLFWHTRYMLFARSVLQAARNVARIFNKSQSAKMIINYVGYFTCHHLKNSY